MMNARELFARYAQGGMVDEVGELRANTGGDVSKARQMLQNLQSPVQHFANGSEVSKGLKYATGEGGIGAAQYYTNIRNFVNEKAADLNADEIRAEMNKYGVSDKDVRDALAGTQYSAGAIHALLNKDIGAQGAPGRGVGGLEGMSENIRARLEQAQQQALAGTLTKPQVEEFFQTHLSPTGGFNEADLVRATGKTSKELLAGMQFKGQPPVILPPTQPLPDLEETFTPPTAPEPQAPPPALTAGAEGLDPDTAIVAKIPESERVKLPQLDTEFRASAPRTAVYDRFGRISGYNYTPSTKLTPATGTNVFNFVPPGITSRPRSLLNLGDVPGVTVDPVTGQLRMPLSASQRFARDRSELDNQFRQLYARAAASDTSLPAQAPAGATAAFRQFAMSDPTMSAQLRMRDIEQTPTVNPTAAMTAARSQFGQAPYAAALTAAFDPFLARNRAALLATVEDQKGYFERYPDIQAEYEKNWAKTMTPDEYALYHYRTLGQKEGRTAPNLMGSPYTRQFFSKGGEASTEDFIKKQSGGDVSRGTSEVPQLDAEGRLIDENAEMRSESQRMLNRLKTAQQEGYRRGKLPPGVQRAVTDVMSEDKPPLVRGKAIQTAGDIVGGLVSATPREPTNPSEAYRLAQGFTGAYLPTAPVAKTGQAAGMAISQPRATVSAARQSLEALGDIPTALAQPNQLGAQAGAVRPYGKGTVFSGVRLSGGQDVQSSLDRYVDQGKNAAYSVSDANTADAIQKFFDTKARRYMSTQLGTEKDPIFDAIKKGRISNLALHDIQGLRKYAIEAAGEGKYKVDKETGKPVMDAYGRPIFYPKDPRAVMDVTKGYDEMVDIKPISFKPGLIPQSYHTMDPMYQAEAERLREQMRQAFEAEGLDPRLVNLTGDPMILTSARDTGKPFYGGYMYRMDDFIKAKLSGDPEAMKNVPENIRRALDQNELLYDVSVKQSPLEDILDPENMANYLATLSPKEIDKIRFEDAVVGSAKFNREKIDRRFEGLRLKELVESGKAPDSVFSKGVSKPLLQFGEDQRHPGFAWKRIEDLEATIPEGAYVGHSVGGYALGGAGYGPSYTKGFQEGTHEIYSLRNARNRPVTTIQVINLGSKDNPFRVVKQIKGNGVKTGNTAPVNYDEEVYDFLTQVVKPDSIQESDTYLTPLLIQYRDLLEANRQTR